MKKHSFIFIMCLLFGHGLKAQMSSSAVFITKTYSQNGNYYIKCIPYDNEEPSLRGKSGIYNKHDKLIYTIDRGFNGLGETRNFIAISNDGKTIIYIIVSYPNDNVDGLKSISIYREGKLVKSFTQMQVTGCDPQNDRCNLVYSNFDKVIDFDRSGFGTKNYHKVFKDGVSEQEKFLSAHAIVLNNDHVYLTDPNKIVHIFDLHSTAIEANIALDSVYPQLKNKKGADTTIYQRFETPYVKTDSSFPNLADGSATAQVLANQLGLKTACVRTQDFYKYKLYRISIEAYISRDGTIDIQKIDADKKLPLDTITRFFKTHRYDISFVPAEFDKWYFRYFFCEFRNSSDEQALQEKQQEEKDMQLAREKRMTMDSINGVYIPKNLEECFTELDKKLPNVTKKEMSALKSKSDMIQYHLGLGTWLRNTWSLWGGSRLVQYFTDHGIASRGSHGPDPEGISTVILMGYYDWLKGDKNAAKEWEEKYPLVH